MLDLLGGGPESAGAATWHPSARFWPDLTAATIDLAAPVAVIEESALRHNALDLLVRAGGVPIRVASKSVRVRAVLDAVLRLPGFAGILAYSLDEALWLAADHQDIVLGYPSADRDALRRLASDDRAAARVTLMVDDLAQLDLIDALVPPSSRPCLRVAVDADASWRGSLLGHIGVRRSPVHSVEEVAALARRIASRPGYRLVGVMMYEAQVAGQPDKAGGGDAVIRWMQRRSVDELRERRAAIVAAVREIAPLEFVNGGGTGSFETTSADESVTELTAGSGLLAGHLFDLYRAFTPAPAAAFALDVVRRPAERIATLAGGGWIASGPAKQSRQPRPVWPEGLQTLAREGAGEVQTPVQGRAAARLRVGDRVWFRHAKSGELAERVDRFQIVRGDRLLGEVPSYRGEGRSFL